MAHLCKDASITFSTEAFSALLDERKGHKNSCEVLTLEKQCIPGLTVKPKKLQEKSARREKAETASKTTPKRQIERATAANTKVATLQTKLASDKASHSQLAEVTTRSKADANEARPDLQNAQARFVEGGQEAK